MDLFFENIYTLLFDKVITIQYIYYVECDIIYKVLDRLLIHILNIFQPFSQI